MDFELFDIEENNIREKYLTVFNSELGLEILADILINFCHLGCFLNVKDEAEVGQYNVGISILSRMGVFSAGADKTKIINQLISGGFKKNG